MANLIKAPFNFVPLNDKVFIPNWSEEISHDIPFEDGESGEIDYELTAVSPLFIRNGHTRNDANGDNKKNENYTSFSKDAYGNYFIPATSIKGMVRNVLEIISFGKMDKISNERFSIRDLQLNDYLTFFQSSDIHCGWMTKKDHTIEVFDHGIPRRISHEELDEKWGTEFDSIFKDPAKMKLDANRTALYKITKATGKELNGNFAEKPLNPNNKVVDKRIKVNFDPKGTLEGTIVMTGQPGVRKDAIINNEGKQIIKGSGKCYEFVFPKAQVTKVLECDYFEEVGLFSDFCFIYKDSVDWNYWKEELKKGKPVPVFFSLNKDGKLQHMGLSYLYKLPYPKKIKEYLPSEHLDNRLDLSECIFGATSDKKSLKGRVQFLNVKLIEGGVSDEVKEPYMGSPKPTYYPIYIVQKGEDGTPENNFTTMLNNSAKLKGWKRYPVHEQVAEFKTVEENQKKNLSPFYPINPGSKFAGKIHFHNLKKTEIGALLNALKFDNSGFHSLGFAKPYGYGKVRIDIKNLDKLKFTKEDYINSFKSMMREQIPNYSNSTQIKELLAMSSPQNTYSPLEYMDLQDFSNHKKQIPKKDINGQYLEYYSKLIIPEKKVDPIPKEVEAIITFSQNGLLKAKLIEGKNQSSLKLEEFPKNKKCKVGDHIMVKTILSGGNIKNIIYSKSI